MSKKRGRPPVFGEGETVEVSVYLLAVQAAAVQGLADQLGCNRSQVYREAVGEYLASHGALPAREVSS